MTFREFLEALLSASFEPPTAPAAPQSPPPPTVPGEARVTALLPHVPGTRVYYSLDGTAALRFKFEVQTSGGIRIYILEQPPYRGRSEESIPTHRIVANGRTFICFDPLPQTAEDAKRIARAWAELTLRYIRTGERF